jgi:hypothetical protein
MSIFPRRIVQRLVNESAKLLSLRQIGTLVQRLNDLADPNDALAAEWELVLLSAFEGFGPIQHEPRLSGSRRRPDLLFGPKDGISFLADITTASDKGIRILYPVEAFTAALREKINGRGLRGNSFAWELRNANGGVYRGGSRPQLRLCPARRFTTSIFNSDFEKFLTRVLDRPTDVSEYLIDNVETFVRIIYDPGIQFSMGRHSAFEYFHSETENMIFDRLEDKAVQLKGAGLGIPTGIFLCDGGTSLLRARKSFQSYSIEEVVARFLEHRPEVAFVAILTVREPSSNAGSSGYRVRVDLHMNPKQATVAATLRPFLDLLASSLPHPRHTPTNARLRLEEGEPNYKFCYFGGMRLTGRSIRMSTKTLLEVLAGRMSIGDFAKHYSVDRRAAINPFTQKLQNGQMITVIKIHNQPDQDDDEVTIEFGDPDPALTSFRTPPRGSRK